MATFVLIPGAGGESWYWHRVVPELEARGHEVVAPDLPAGDDDATFEDYADAVVEAAGEHRDLVVVAQSLGAFTAPLACARLAVDLLVLTAAMVPQAGERAADWWDHTGAGKARVALAEQEGRPADADDLDVMEYFFHDVPANVVAEALARPEPAQSGTPMTQPLPLDVWPDVPTRFLLFRDDRFFPADFMRTMVPDRLGIVPDEMDGGHLAALSRPVELAERLHAYWSNRSVL